MTAKKFEGKKFHSRKKLVVIATVTLVAVVTAVVVILASRPGLITKNPLMMVLTKDDLPLGFKMEEAEQFSFDEFRNRISPETPYHFRETYRGGYTISFGNSDGGWIASAVFQFSNIEAAKEIFNTLHTFTTSKPTYTVISAPDIGDECWAYRYVEPRDTYVGFRKANVIAIVGTSSGTSLEETIWYARTVEGKM